MMKHVTVIRLKNLFYLLGLENKELTFFEIIENALMTFAKNSDFGIF